MSYLLRFVQKFQESNQAEFLELEKKFILLEESTGEFPKGKRYLPYAGREASNTLIWECEFPTLQAVQDAIDLLNRDPRHTELFKQQVKFFEESYVEIYQTLNDK
jgi:hypothetical protein